MLCKTCRVEKDTSNFHKEKLTTCGYRLSCKECVNKKARERYYKNKEAHAERVKRSVAKRKAEGKDVNKASREYAKRNPHYKRFYASQRKKHVKTATPPWITPEQKQQMRDIHRLRMKMEQNFGLSYHVDHIVPLRGENVCGLNVPWNLQILEASLNLAKRNTFAQ